MFLPGDFTTVSPACTRTSIPSPWQDSLLVYLVSPNPAVRRYELDLIRQVKANNDVVGTLVACFEKPELEESCYDLCVG